MGNIDQYVPDEGQDEVVFKSEDIATRTKAGQKKKYFVKFKEKPLKVRLSEWFTKYKKKILIIMCVTVAALVLIATIITIITALTRPKPEPEKDWNEEVSKVEDEIEKYRQDLEESEDATPFTNTIVHFQQQYDQETDPDKKFSLLVAQIKYLTNQEEYDAAERLLSTVKTPELTDKQRYLRALAAYNLYLAQENYDKADFYSKVIDQLPDEAKPAPVGGGA